MSRNIDGSAVFRSALFTCDGAHVGCSALTSAAIPVTCGVAIDVPLSCSKNGGRTLPSWSTIDDRMLAPGAAISGLIVIVGAGPRLLKLEMTSGQPERRRCTGPSMSTVGLAFVCAQLTIARPSPSVTITAGSVGPWNPPMAVGPSGPLLCTIIAISPAASALFFFTSNVQFPRAMSAILPVMLPDGSAAQASPASVPLPPGATVYTPEIVDAIGGAGTAPGTPTRSWGDAGGGPGPLTLTPVGNTRPWGLLP